MIVPHAGLDYSGLTQAFAYYKVKPELYKRIFILGPSHYEALNSCALSMCGTYDSPLREFEIDLKQNMKLRKEGEFK